MIQRPPFNKEDISQCIKEVQEMIGARLVQKGPGIFASSFETMGIVKIEYNEYEKEVRIRDFQRQRDELMDIAVAAILGMASIDSGKMDW